MGMIKNFAIEAEAAGADAGVALTFWDTGIRRDEAINLAVVVEELPLGRIDGGITCMPAETAREVTGYRTPGETRLALAGHTVQSLTAALIEAPTAEAVELEQLRRNCVSLAFISRDGQIGAVEAALDTDYRPVSFGWSLMQQGVVAAHPTDWQMVERRDCIPEADTALTGLITAFDNYRPEPGWLANT